jgi:hypothetical protein
MMASRRRRVSLARLAVARMALARMALALLILAAWQAAPAWGQATVEPPRGFRGIDLGMEVEQVKTLLTQDPLFDYRGDPDVSLLPQPPQTLVEVRGSSYVSRAYFQFQEGRLYVMILALNRDRLDYYTLYTTLSAKYGEPASLDPTEAAWLFPGLRLSLERPLSVKYIDTGVFEALQEEGKAEQDLRGLSEQRFLEQF